MFLPRSIRGHESYEGAQESFTCLMRFEGIAGPRDEMPVGLPTIFGSDTALRSSLESLIVYFQDVFGEICNVFRRKRMIEHFVNTGSSEPGHLPVCQLSPSLLGPPKERLVLLEAAGFIRPWTSSWSSSIVMVKHPLSGKVRLCVDLNTRTTIIQECFDAS